ncbi:phthioceranic/hydroxyphthioceranic acid synthase-like [Pyxicephalus adspersus]|uniref:phthioceranic/hydroxyphthioceranic acid synthase-like n=1 Tax=Pyxicephalus adspersus TaxID=30357 RepID=UPI003B59E043
MKDLEDAIAIVGIGCNFPGGEGIDNFWKVIVEGKSCTVEIPEERFSTKHWNDSDYTKICRAGIVQGIHMFDNKLFGIHKSESDHMDPQHKLLLQCTYRALEDAGYAMESISGSNTGVFIGDCEMAICGGVSCIIDPHIYIALSKAKMISPEGTSKPFSKNADGYGRGEGCGIVVLKPLKQQNQTYLFLQAKKDYSKIWGIICACSVNQDGRSVTPITKPSQEQQEKLLRRIYTDIDPCSLQYVEAHGTGTPVGDPIEATSIGNIIGKKRPNGMKLLKIGSVKGNIGHTESAAGMAALIKVLLMMQHEMIPPSLHYSKENGIKEIEDSKLVVPTVSENWHEDAKFGRMAGVNCFGFGGTNSHVVVKQYKENNSKHHSKRPAEIFILSAASSKSLQLSIEDTVQELSKMQSSLSLENLVYTAACRRTHINFRYRAAFLASSLPSLQKGLQSVNTETHPIPKSPQIVFVFCGNGVLSKGMCKVLLENEEIFKAKCLEVDKMIRIYTSLSVVQLLENEYDDFSSPDVAQLLLFTIQVSLVHLLRHWGVNPDCVVGHSVGEVAAGYCSGLLSLEDAVKIIYHRSKLQCTVTGGKMLVVGNVPVTEISNTLLSYNGKVCMAAYNSTSSCTLSGDEEAIQRLSDHLSQHYKKKNIFLHVLDVPAAYHSHLMDPILDDTKNILQNLHTNNLECELISTVTGKPAIKGDFTTGEYWARNIREPVVFEQAIKASANNKEHVVFIEIGPRRALQKNIVDILGPNTTVMPAVHPRNEYETIFSLLIALFKKGYNPSWNNLFAEYKTSPSHIPRYQFEHNNQDIRFDQISQGNQSAASVIHPLLHSVNADFTEFKCTLSKSLTSYVYEHKNLGAALVPGSFFVELGLAAAVTSLKPRVPLHCLKMSAKFLNPCVLQKESQELNVKMHQKDQVIHFEILTSHVYATGHVQRISSWPDSDKRIYIEHIVKRCQTIFKKEEVYKLLSTFGFEYGKVYRQLCDVHYGEKLMEGIAKIKIEEVKETMYEYHIHPVILDCFLQMVVCVVGSRINEAEAIFPSSIGSIMIFQPLQEEMVIYIKTIRITSSYAEVCGCFADNNGTVLAEIKNARIALMKRTARTQANDFFQIQWTKAPSLENVSQVMPNMLIYADNSGVSQQISTYIREGVSYIHFNSWDSDIQLQKLQSSRCKDIVFMWGIHSLSDAIPINPTQYLAKCCEVYRQLILAVRQMDPGTCIKTVTFRTTESTVDHINPGFVFVGMSRTCITEVQNITFQLIDIGSSNPQDIAALAQVLLHYNPNEYPEIKIIEGCIYTGEITYTDIENSRQLSAPLEKSDNFTLCTSNIHKMDELSAEPNNSRITENSSKDVEIKIDKIGVHTEDYFPVSLSSWQYGDTLYWNEDASDKHKLILLDLAGTVTAVGRDVRKIHVGDKVASCYPTVANSKVRLPESVCCLTKKLALLRDSPFVSLFVLAWEILHKQLPSPKNKPKLAIVTTEEKSVLNTILLKAAKQRGWETVITSGSTANAKQCSAMIILPTSEVISGEDLAQLSLLKDVVIIRDHKNSTHFQNLAINVGQNIHLHILDLGSVFQTAYLQRFSKDVYKWLRSLSSNIPIILPKSIIQLSNSKSNLNTVSSYFKAQSLPLIELDNNTIAKIPMSVSDEVLFRHNAVYIVTGGLTGLGFETVKFILHNGGGHVVIFSRRTPNAEMKQQIAKAQSEKENAKIITLPCDIGHYCEVKKAIDSLQKNFPNIPIKGVFHSAVVLHDGILEMLNLSLFEKVLSPKIDGVVNLHHATINHKLDFFVCYSSVASLVGSSGQANYAAANSFLDIFCQYRRNLGLPAHSINWGALNIGLLLNKQQVHDILKNKGLLLLNVPEIHANLKKSLLINNTQQGIVRFDFKLMYDNLISRIPVMKKRFYNLVMEYLNNFDDKVQVKQSKINKQKAEDYVLSLVSELTNVTLTDITMSSLLNTLGIDSMLAITLQHRIFEEKEVNVPVVRLLDPNTTILDVASWIKENSTHEENLVENIILETWL